MMDLYLVKCKLISNLLQQIILMIMLRNNLVNSHFSFVAISTKLKPVNAEKPDFMCNIQMVAVM